MKSSICAVVVALFATFSLCQSACAEHIYGVAAQGSSNFLVKWDSSSPTVLASSIALGPSNGDAMVGIDFRPLTGVLYGLGASGRVYTIALNTGFAQEIGFASLLNGFSFGFDFNPSIDRIRVTSDVNTNLVLNPITGTLQLAATNLAYGPADPNLGVDPNVGASAYSNNIPMAPSTQLYGIDMGLDVLVTQTNNAGVLSTVGPLGVNVSSLGGFDVSGTSGVAYATMTPAGSSQSNFYAIDLATGSASSLGPIGGGIVITAMTAAPVPEPTTLIGALTAFACVAGFCRRLP